MFSNKKNVNILTSLLSSHGIRRAVVCPGSRNAPVVNDLNECGNIKCYPVTDERSAGFYALGMALADDNPVVVCVTSGTALLNLAPAVAEASYRHCGLVVVSADRPEERIGQLDGQTIPQVGALGCFVSKCVTLPEPVTDYECHYCNRLVNEVLTAVRSAGRMSVHINVPVSEPLFDFSQVSLPVERVVDLINPVIDTKAFNRNVSSRLAAAKRPMIVAGQLSGIAFERDRRLNALSSYVALLSEPLSVNGAQPFDMLLSKVAEDKRFMPDFILYLGDTTVSKKLKTFLRNMENVEIWAVSADGSLHDTFNRLTGVVYGNALSAVDILYDTFVHGANSGEKAGTTTFNGREFAALWNNAGTLLKDRIDYYEPEYSQTAVVKEFERSLENMEYAFHVHYANSTAIRLANIYSWHYVWCNRGINGIEGSLSTAAGHSLATDDTVFCVIGDLSFFYDQNALWNTNLKGNLRIIMLNNGCGGIFYRLKGLKDSKACDRLIAAAHNTTAQGICTQCDVGYLSARNDDELHIGLAALMTSETSRPMLLEVFTEKSKDEKVIKGLMEYCLNY